MLHLFIFLNLSNLPNFPNIPNLLVLLPLSDLPLFPFLLPMITELFVGVSVSFRRFNRRYYRAIRVLYIDCFRLVSICLVAAGLLLLLYLHLLFLIHLVNLNHVIHSLVITIPTALFLHLIALSGAFLITFINPQLL